MTRIKISPNDPCPCGTGKKYKRCCQGKVDWERIVNSGEDQIEHLSIRGRNLLFVTAIFDALGVDTDITAANLPQYKKAFTAEAIRKINEAVVELWPTKTNIEGLLGKSGADVSGLYIGDYAPSYVSRALVRHSIYANKILLVDPFIHPYVLRDEYNPIVNPEQYRAQTLRNVNFYLSLLPWIDAGIVEFIRTPADFDRQLNADSIRRAQTLFEAPELRAAADAIVEVLKERHLEAYKQHDLLLSAPDSYLKRIFAELGLGNKRYTFDDFLKYVQILRDNDPNFLEPLGTGENNAQLRMEYSGGTYEMARLAAQMAGSYLFTDLQAKWALIEKERKQTSAENQVWSPFAKSIQNLKLHYLNNLELDHALAIRKENRLENVRALLTKVWGKVRSDEPFDEQTTIHFANELTEAVNEAETEWIQIQADVVKYGGTGIAAGIASGGAAVATGQALWAAASLVGAVTFAAWARLKNVAYLKRYPAAFFMDLRNKE